MAKAAISRFYLLQSRDFLTKKIRIVLCMN